LLLHLQPPLLLWLDQLHLAPLLVLVLLLPA
jgi:hypothetical protein